MGTTSAAYPFLPRHLTVASTFGVGLPALVLALAPSSGPWRSETFLRDVARFAVPAGIAVGCAVLGAYVTALHALSLSVEAARTVSTTVMLGGLLFIVVELERASARRHHLVELLAVTMAACYATALLIGPVRDFFSLAAPDFELVALSAAGLGTAAALTALGLRLTRAAPTRPAWQRGR